MSSQHPASSSRSIHLRVVALSAIFFFTSLQFKTLKALFGSSVGDANIDAAWAPDNFGDPKPNTEPNTEPKTKRRGRGGHRTKAGKEERQKELSLTKEKEKEDKHKNKRIKKSARFMASNYTSDFEPLPWTLPEPTPLRYQTSEEFMADYIAAKKKKNIPLPWEQQDKYAGKAVTLPLPIISLNFPKSATLTMKSFFDCGGITSIHTSTINGRIAVCMMENQLNDKPPMDGCNTHRPRGAESHELVPIDFISDIGLQGPPCYYASVHDGGLENIAKYYPNATILLVTRNATSWHRSIAKWGSLLHRLKKYCGFDGSLHDGDNMEYWNNMYTSLPRSKEEYWVHFYQAHTQKIREFAMKHLSMTYVEVELENEKLGEILERYTSVSASCVMDCHPGPKWVRENNATSRCHAMGENPANKNAKPDIEEEEESGDDEDDDNTDGGDDTEEDVSGESEE